MSNAKYELNPERVIHQTDTFAIDVGSYPGEELDCYRIWNMDTQVLEYAHSVLFYAIQWAKSATEVLKNGAEEGAELPGAA